MVSSLLLPLYQCFGKHGQMIRASTVAWHVICACDVSMHLTCIVSYGFELPPARYRAPEILLRSSYYTPAIGMAPSFAIPFSSYIIFEVLDDISASCLYIWLANIARPDNHSYKLTVVIEKGKDRKTEIM